MGSTWITLQQSNAPTIAYLVRFVSIVTPFLMGILPLAMFDYQRRTNEHLHHGAGLKARYYSTLTTLLQLNGLQE